MGALLKRAQRTESENELRPDGGDLSFKAIQKLPEHGSAGKACLEGAWDRKLKSLGPVLLSRTIEAETSE